MKTNDTVKPYSMSDKLFALGMLFIGYMFCSMWLQAELGVYATLFTVTITLITGIFLQSKGFTQNSRSVICLIVIALSAGLFVLVDNNNEKWLNLIFVGGIYIYWVALTTRNTKEKGLSGYVAIDFADQIFKKGFENFNAVPSILKSRVENKQGRKWLEAIIGIIITIPVVIVVIKLLGQVDPIFQDLIGGLDRILFEDVFEELILFMLGIPVSLYVGSLIWSNITAREEKRGEGQIEKTLEGNRIVPQVTIYAGLTLINLIYLIFLGNQVVRLFSAFDKILPDGMNYSQYARQGFFELCAVAVINLGITIFVYVLAKKSDSKTMRAQIGVLSLFTIMLTAMGISKMILYIQRYGLTPLRVYTSIFMLLLAIVFIIILIRQLIKFNSGRIIIVASILFFLGTCYFNVDKQVAKYNVREYLNGNIDMMDVEFMLNLSDGAVPYIYEGYSEAEDILAKVMFAEAIVERDFEYSNWRIFNMESDKAKKIKEREEFSMRIFINIEY